MPSNWSSGVYPRACGGTVAILPLLFLQTGLSPRMRGNPGGLGTNALPDGSIPAHAGEPRRSAPSPETWGVYPRACGGTVITSTLHVRSTGLSPRMRGNLFLTSSAGQYFGSIPAHAGEPGTQESWHRPRWVYPRACGGTSTASESHSTSAGLSPRMRGNLQALSPPFRWPGSIPAHAGEPSTRGSMRLWLRVYPRACGGTGHCQPICDHTSGLSPRMRGNPMRLLLRGEQFGSIPAHAGEPAAPWHPPTPSWVYPRACGGTAPPRRRMTSPPGLSPRMRGNPDRQRCRCAGQGSIPAHAGEP